MAAVSLFNAGDLRTAVGNAGAREVCGPALGRGVGAAQPQRPSAAQCGVDVRRWRVRFLQAGVSEIEAPWFSGNSLLDDVLQPVAASRVQFDVLLPAVE